jgi:surface antigen
VGTVDHVFASKNVRVTGYHRIESRRMTASDHGVTYIDASLPGTTSEGQKQGASHAQYVGVDKHGTIVLRKVAASHLLGAIRLSPATPAVKTGSDFLGNDGFAGGQCTEYVDYELSRHAAHYTPGQYPDGKDFANFLARFGYTVNHTPAVHATVSFGTAYANPEHGHVALVAKVNQDGSIVVEEANWDHYEAYGTHTVPASEVPHLTFAHTEVGWH